VPVIFLGKTVAEVPVRNGLRPVDETETGKLSVAPWPEGPNTH
jgi:hypothetical protein